MTTTQHPHPPTTRTPPARNGHGTAALTLALTGLVFTILPPLAFILGGLAVLFGLLGLGRLRRGEATNNGVTATGTFLGAGVALLGLVLTVAIVGSAPTAPSGGTTWTPPPAAPGPAPQPPTIPAGEIPAGIHVVGVDIQPGTYRTAGTTSTMGMPCYWARLSGTGGTLGDVIANGLPDGPTTITVDAGDAAFETSRCATWRLVG
ncbi:MAG: hypothetical protein ACRD0V_21450 [Acidimicrobiales bacterium]